MKKLWIFLLFLSGCNPFGFARPTSESIQNSGWASKSPTPKDYPKPYCYKTLGDIACFSSPQDEDAVFRRTCLDISPKEGQKQSPPCVQYIKTIKQDIENTLEEINR